MSHDYSCYTKRRHNTLRKAAKTFERGAELFEWDLDLLVFFRLLLLLLLFIKSPNPKPKPKPEAFLGNEESPVRLKGSNILGSRLIYALV